ncbi:MAG TPA: glycoside hydrolase family 2 protein [Candidatus Binatia bacterium]|nr:glycoside hydrolase family 2 protein [Candidatus Binatia bacterium]
MPLHAAEPNLRPLNSGWEFRAVNAGDHPEVSGWHAAQVPGVVQTDLLADRVIPEPFYGDNESRLQWIGLTDWEYRTTFQIDAATLQHEHLDLIFDGLDTFAEVFLNEQPVLSADNMFRRWRVEAKPLLKAGPNTLRVVFRSPITSLIPKVKALPYILPSVSTVNAGNEENVATAPYTRKAPYQYGWDWGPRYVTIGIWKPVWLESWDSARIEDLHIRQVKVAPDAAELEVEIEVESSHPQTATISVSYQNIVSGETPRPETRHSSPLNPRMTQTAQLDAGTNHISIPLRITSPKLWYPAGYGAQERYRFTASVMVGKAAIAQAEVKTGLRSLELRRVPDEWGKSFTFVVNGIPIFAKGANVIPFDSFPSRVTRERHRPILQAARDANMNMVREWGGGIYESDDFYDICDELGLMVWQEFVFGGDMVPGDLAFEENVREEATQQVKRLRDHPSIVLWCGNNEIEAGWLVWADRLSFKESITPPQRERVWQDYVVLFHDIIRSAVQQYGSPTPYWPSSPSADFEAPPNSPDNGDMHYWGVWHSLEPVENYTLQETRFMSEFGFQSFPEMRTVVSFAPPGELAIDSAAMQSHQKNHGGNERILTYMLREYPEPRDFASFVYVSQVQQAEAIKVGAEHLRRNRGRTMGALFWQLNDCWPVASWSSVDYFGRWKALQYYARRFYADLLISPFAHDGVVDVYVVSDRLQETAGEIHMRLLDFTGKTLLDKTQEVQIPAQSSAVYLSTDEKQVLGPASPEQAFLVFELKVAGETVSRNEVFFDRMRNLELPLKPAIQSDFAGSGGDYTMRLRSPVLARNAYLAFGDLDVTLSDNYFDLLPGEEMTVRVKSSATLEQLQRALRITSLTDAFFDERPTYREHGLGTGGSKSSSQP